MLNFVCTAYVTYNVNVNIAITITSPFHQQNGQTIRFLTFKSANKYFIMPLGVNKFHTKPLRIISKIKKYGSNLIDCAVEMFKMKSIVINNNYNRSMQKSQGEHYIIIVYDYKNK